jgi:two-component system chemotaxis response regulator CheY
MLWQAQFPDQIQQHPLRKNLMKILVVDDDPTCRTIMAIRLKRLEGIEVSEAEDGDEAWALLKRNHYDGVIVDWQMPGKTGLEIVRGIRQAGSTIPLLMVTAESEKQRVVEAIRAGVTDYLVKPFDSEALLAKLGKFVESI